MIFAGATGRSAQEIKSMSMWELMMVRHGHSLTQPKGESETKEISSGMSDEEFERIMSMELEEHTVEFDGRDLEKHLMKKRGR